jgi:hypothetical protein
MEFADKQTGQKNSRKPFLIHPANHQNSRKAKIESNNSVRLRS